MQMPIHSDDHVNHHMHHGMSDHHGGQGMMAEPTQLVVEGSLMKLLAQSPDGTLMCCANDTQLKFVDSRFLKLYETNTPGPITAACFHPQKYELFLKIDQRTLVFDLATKEYRQPEDSDTMIPPEPWLPPPPPAGAILSQSGMGMGLGLTEKRRSGSGRPKGSKDKSQRKPRSAAAQEFEKEVMSQLISFCGEDSAKWNAKKPAIDAIKASPMWDAWSKAGLNEQQLVQFVHRLKAAHSKRGPNKDMGGGGGGLGKGMEVNMSMLSHQAPNSLSMQVGHGGGGMGGMQAGFLSGMPMAHLSPHHLAAHYPVSRGPM